MKKRNIKHYRRIPWEEALKISPEIKAILLTCPLKNNHRHIIVDVKIQWIKAGTSTEVVGWHTDFRKTPSTETSHELNHLWCSTLGTLFKEEDGTVWQAEPKKWYSYTREKVHKGPTAEHDTDRIFIRVSETMERYR